MIDILRIISTILIVTPFIYYLLDIIINKNKKISEYDGFNITKDIIHEYDMINIILDKGIVSYYNLKRGVIKLSNKCYYGSDLCHICMGLMEAGISVIDKIGNKYINIFKNIIYNLKILYIFPLITVIINYISYTKGDAKIGLIVVVISTVVVYMINNIVIEASGWVCNNINKVNNIVEDEKKMISNYFGKIVNLNKIIFWGELVSIIMLVAILIQV